MPEDNLPEPYHAFDDPINDRILGVVLALATEVWLLRDRLGLLEVAISKRGLDVSELIEELAADPEGSADRVEGFIERIMRPIVDYKHTSAAAQSSPHSLGEESELPTGGHPLPAES